MDLPHFLCKTLEDHLLPLPLHLALAWKITSNYGITSTQTGQFVSDIIVWRPSKLCAEINQGFREILGLTDNKRIAVM